MKGMGIWIAFHEMAQQRAMKSGFPGTYQGIAQHIKSMGFDWVASNFYGLQADPFQLTQLLHNEGLGSHFWFYSYPDNVPQDIVLTKNLLHVSDGVIVNAEVEWKNRHKLAKETTDRLLKLKEEPGLGELSHAPLSWLRFHQDWPYDEFNRLGAVHPQLYWTELNTGSYEGMMKGPGQQWSAIQASDKVDVYPIGCTYGKGDLTSVRQPPGIYSVDDLNKFLQYCNFFDACSLYSYEVMRPDVEAYLIGRVRDARYANAPEATEKGETEPLEKGEKNV